MPFPTPVNSSASTGRWAIAGIVAGIVGWLVDFVLHGMMLGDTYARLDTVFSQTQSSPFSFLAISLATYLLLAYLFHRTRGAWAAGPVGGIVFGVLMGLVATFGNLYDPIVIADFPYYLAWCQGGAAMINGAIGGAILGALISHSG